MTLGGGVLNCWGKTQKSVALSSWESELFAAITSGTRSLGIQSELMDLWYSSSVTVATDSQSVIDHSRRRANSVASKHVGLVWGDSGCRKLWKTRNWSLRKWILQRIPLMYATKRYLDIGFASCVGCTYAAVKKTWVTIPTNGI